MAIGGQTKGEIVFSFLVREFLLKERKAKQGKLNELGSGQLVCVVFSRCFGGGLMMILLVATSYLLLIYCLLTLAGRKYKTERPASRRIQSGN
ncbi:MAG: hypothetical protein AAGA60_21590 [Cyanobacteria bacterium P01_E01_bin.42]